MQIHLATIDGHVLRVTQAVPGCASGQLETSMGGWARRFPMTKTPLYQVSLLDYCTTLDSVRLLH